VAVLRCRFIAFIAIRLALVPPLRKVPLSLANWSFPGLKDPQLNLFSAMIQNPSVRNSLGRGSQG
jgi:hypothetical protein